MRKVPYYHIRTLPTKKPFIQVQSRTVFLGLSGEKVREERRELESCMDK